jgi:transposase
MGHPKKQRPPLPPIWEAADNVWAIVEPILTELDPPKPYGRTRFDQRAAFDAISFRLRTGCQSNHLPAEFPDGSSVHRTFQRWVERGVFDRLWAVIHEACEELGGCDWEWQAAPRSARPEQGDHGGPNPTGLAQNGVTRSLIVEADGGSLEIAIAGANVPDVHLLAETIGAIVLEPPPVEAGYEQHLCLDKGHDNEPGWGACDDHDDQPYIALVRDERPERPPGYTSRAAGSWSARWDGCGAS